jgi:hypothetical protein
MAVLSQLQGVTEFAFANVVPSPYLDQLLGRESEVSWCDVKRVLQSSRDKADSVG